MKVGIEKKYVTAADIGRFRKANSVFKGLFTDNDLLRFFKDTETINDCIFYGSKPIEVSVLSFPSGYYYGYESVSFAVDIIAYSFDEFYKVSFYMMADFDGEQFTTAFEPIIYPGSFKRFKKAETI